MLTKAEAAPEEGHAGVWLHMADTMSNEKLTTPIQREWYRLELERRFEAVLKTGDKFAADLTVPHLRRIYRKAIFLPERHRILRNYAEMHRRLSENTSALVAVSSLLAVVEMLEDEGLQEDAATSGFTPKNWALV